MKKLINIFTKIFTLFFIILFIALILYFFKYKVSINNLSLIKIFKILFLFSNLFFWIWVFIAKKNYKRILVSSYVSIIFAFYTAEFILEKKSKFKRFEFFLKENKNYDTRSKFEIYSELKKKENVVPLYYPYNQLIKKRKVSLNIKNEEKDIILLSGVSNSKTIVCNESGEYLIYKSDKYGFNNPNKLWSNQANAILLGDSMTLGECVKPKEDISSVLRKNLKKNIINLGMGGNGPLFQLAVLKEYHHLTNSKKIIWVYYEGNDLLDLFNEKQNKILMKYLNPNFRQNLSDHQKKLDHKIMKVIHDEYKNFKNQKLRSFLFLWKVRGSLENFYSKKNEKLTQNNTTKPINKKLPSIYQKLIKSDSKNPYKENIKLFEKILEQVKIYSINNNAEHYFIYLPSVARFNGEFEDNEKLFARNEVLKIAQKNQFYIIDTYENFFKFNNNPLKYFPFNGKMRHFNSEGFRIISSIIEKNL
jgi:hypothetical protein